MSPGSTLVAMGKLNHGEDIKQEFLQFSIFLPPLCMGDNFNQMTIQVVRL
jgi:hypothetical protein